MSGGGEYEPNDSRNVHGTASTPDGRWTNKGAQNIDAQGKPKGTRDGPQNFANDHEGEGEGPPVKGEEDAAVSLGARRKAEDPRRPEAPDVSLSQEAPPEGK